MKTIPHPHSSNTAVAALCFVTALLAPTLLFAQGSLTPPGAPAPTMKTLAQIEPRTPVGTNTTPGDASALFKITQPGSYYLTTNITGVAGRHGIAIAASGVTLDLMGFDVAGVAGSLDGINVAFQLDRHANITVRNGSVRDWGGAGVNVNSGINEILQDLRVYKNGGQGIYAGIGCLVSGCIARTNLGTGIATGGYGVVNSCIAVGNRLYGINAGTGSTVSGCMAHENASYGILTDGSGTVSGCAAIGNGTNGISVWSGTILSGCTVVGNTGDGIQAASNCEVAGNSSSGNTLAGIRIRSTDTRIDRNNVIGNLRGLDVANAGNLIIRNSASGNTNNFSITANNKVGVIVAAPNSGIISGNGGGAGVGSTDPWANISF